MSTVAGERDPQQRLPLLPAAVAALDALLLLTAVGIWFSRRIPFDVLTSSYLLGNATIGAGFAAGGALITLRVRRNPVGWLMLLGGSLYLLAAAVGSVLYLRITAGDTGDTARVLALVFVHVWMPAVALFIPLAVQLFPTGRPINRFWRVYLVLTVIGGLAATSAWLLQPGPLGIPGVADQRGLVPGELPAWLQQATRIASLGGLLAAGSLLAPLHRLVRRRGEERLQVLWLVWAVGIVLVATLPSAVTDVPEPLPLLTVPLIPLAMTAAVLRHRLYGITLVLNRTAVYLALTVTLLAGYLALVYGLGRLVPSTGLRQVLATGAVAVAFSPLRARLQRGVDRLMFGSGADPYGVLSELGSRLQSPMTPDQVLPAIATTLAGALRLPYVQVRAGRPGTEPVRTVEHGTPVGPTTTFPLTHRGEEVGALVVGTAGRPRGLPGPGRTLLADLVRQAGPAVHSVVLTEELAASRQRTIAALEDERSRIRRDLHDGLGPALTGVMLKAEAAGNLLGPDGGRPAELLAEVGEQTRTAIDDVRRLVYDLRPPALDRLGLRPALEGYVDRLTAARPAGRPSLGLDLPPDLPRLGPAVEVAAYRIITEALTNVVRHSGAGVARARLWVDDGSLHLEVRDDGPTGAGWVPGVGLTSMRERAEQLGGGFAATGSPSGGTVTAWLPVAAGDGAR